MILGVFVFTADLFAYFFAIYHLPGWPWSTWYGIPAFITFTLCATFGMQIAGAAFAAGSDFMKAKPTEKTKNYESPIIKV